jgi:hypothetical protein
MTSKKSIPAIQQSRLATARAMGSSPATYFGSDFENRQAVKLFKPKFQFTRNKADSSFVLGYN